VGVRSLLLGNGKRLFSGIKTGEKVGRDLKQN